MIHARRSCLVAVLASRVFLGSACVPALHVDDDPQITCAGGDDCPGNLVCVAEIGECRSTADLCVTPEAHLVRDGTRCRGDRICVRGECVDPSCGDGVVAASEECDPGSDRLCHDDCRLPICGDGIVDLGESCDTDQPNCIACILSCGPTLEADCNGRTEDGCECGPSQFVSVPDDRATAIPAGFIRDGALTLLTRDADLDYLSRVDLETGETREIASAFIIVMASDSDGAAIARLTQPSGRTVIAEVRDNLVPLFEEPDVIFGLTADATAIYLEDGDRVLVRNRSSFELETTFARPFICARLVICGGALVCDDLTDVALLDVATGASRVMYLGSEGIPIATGCSPQGRPMWTTDRAVVEDLGDTQRSLYALDSGPERFVSAGPLFTFDGDVVLPSFRGRIETIRVSAVTGAVRGIAYGLPYALGENTLVAGPDQAALGVFHLEPAE